MLLKNFIIWTFSGFAEFTSSVHPSPKVLSGSNDVVGDVIKNIIEFVVRRICSEIWMLIVCFDLEKGIASTLRCYWLIDQRLETN